MDAPQSISLADTWYIPVKEMIFLVVLSNNSIWKVGSLRHLFVNVAASKTQWRERSTVSETLQKKTVSVAHVYSMYSHLSNKRGAHAYQFWKISPSSKKNLPSSFIDFITKVSDIIAEPDDNFSHDHFEL